MREVKVEDAIGQILCHDMTQIIPGKFKGAKFRKGHVVREEDIPVLKSMGKNTIYILDLDEGMLHEDEAAQRLKDLCINDYMSTADEIKEGKVEIRSEIDGVFKVDVERLLNANSYDEVAIATRHTNTAVKKGDVLAGMRVIPLVIEEEKIQDVEDLVGSEPLFQILPYQIKKAAIIVTGSEVASGLIEDRFSPMVRKKLESFNVEFVSQEIVSDDKELIKAAISRARATEAEIIFVTGGMSVDPDDRTPAAIQKTGAHIVSYGSPVLPGAMLLLGYFEDKVPIMGLPGCVMYEKATVFDLLLPRVLAGEKLVKRDIAKLGHGGLCLKCDICHYPICPFGKE